MIRRCVHCCLVLPIRFLLFASFKSIETRCLSSSFDVNNDCQRQRKQKTSDFFSVFLYSACSLASHGNLMRPELFKKERKLFGETNDSSRRRADIVSNVRKNEDRSEKNEIKRHQHIFMQFIIFYSAHLDPTPAQKICFILTLILSFVGSTRISFYSFIFFFCSTSTGNSYFDFVSLFFTHDTNRTLLLSLLLFFELSVSLLTGILQWRFSRLQDLLFSRLQSRQSSTSFSDNVYCNQN